MSPQFDPVQHKRGKKPRTRRPPANITNVQGHAIILPPPADGRIPSEEARDCPQCNGIAWRRSRLCKHCGFDFDRAACGLHPVKLLFVSCLVNAALLALIAYLLAAR